MKHLKIYEDINDPSNLLLGGDFLSWLDINYPDENKRSFIRELYCNGQGFTSLEGIEKLDGLELLYCHDNDITNFDANSLKNLKYLWCFNNSITSLRVGDLDLKELWCYNNYLTKIDGLEKLSGLKTLWCSNNRFDNDYKMHLIEWADSNNVKLEI